LNTFPNLADNRTAQLDALHWTVFGREKKKTIKKYFDVAIAALLVLVTAAVGSPQAVRTCPRTC